MNLTKSLTFFFVLVFFIVCAEQPQNFNVVVKDLSIGEKSIRFSPSKDVGVVSLILSFKNAGEKSSPKNKEALVSVLTKAICETTKTKTREQLQDYASEHNVIVSCTSSDDDFIIAAKCPSDKFQQLTSLIKELLLESRFNEKDLVRIKSEMTAITLQSLQSPNAQLEELIKKIILTDHPYGVSQSTYLKSLNSIHPNDLKSYMLTHFSQENLIISVCGEIDENILKSQINDIVQVLPKSSKIALPIDQKIKGPYRTYKQEFPVPQTVIQMLHEGVDINHPDFFALQIAVGCMGSAGIGILWEKIRQEKGLTYGIGAGFSQQDHFNIFCIQTSTQTETVTQTIETIKEVLASIYKDGFPADLVETVKKSFLGNYKRSFSSTQNIATRLMKYQREGRPIDFHNTIIEKISALTTEDVNNAFRRFLKLDEFMIFTVGK